MLSGQHQAKTRLSQRPEGRFFFSRQPLRTSEQIVGDIYGGLHATKICDMGTHINAREGFDLGRIGRGHRGARYQINPGIA